MTAPTTLFRPFSRLVKITILGREFEVPETIICFVVSNIWRRSMFRMAAFAGMRIANTAASVLIQVRGLKPALRFPAS